MKRVETEAELNASSLVFRDAFTNYPLYTFLFPDEAQRARVLPVLFKISTRHVSESAYYLGKQNDVSAILFLDSPGAKGPSVFDALCILFGYAYQLPLARSIKLLQVFRDCMQARPEGRFWYLQMIGVSPHHQGKGIGDQVLQFARQLAGPERIYLETSSEANANYYRNRGYELHKTFPTLGGSGPTTWSLISG
jgi:GNAT superfamily N-acetyltransferase